MTATKIFLFVTKTRQQARTLRNRINEIRPWKPTSRIDKLPEGWGFNVMTNKSRAAIARLTKR